ncbi:MAG: beta-galactosidase trimerization domain-containing protein, partial [Prolixibacteraceae bacterium]|nr:beta-galactosidase trimerization domain-containing protein [Prolixibacteraceae bacterium]
MRLLIFLIFLASGLLLYSQEQSVKEREQDNGIYQPRYCLFYDNNTMAAFPDMGENFDVEAFTDRIKRCGADHLVFHVRCDQGMAYYNTEIGIRHPSLKFDLFGEIADACQRKGIALTAYFNGGISSAEGVAHRDWTTLYFDGREYRDPPFTPYVRTMCYNTGYRDHLISMVREVANNYPVTGFFIDCLGNYPCVCPVCVREMKEKGIDYSNEQEVIKFSEYSAYRLSEDISVAAREVNPDYLLYFSETGYEEQAEIGSYIECIGLPTGGYGYEFLPVMAHYLRTLGDKSVINMTGRFYDWGDFGGLRPEAAIKSELLYGLANGMRPSVGGHFHPRGDLNNAVFDRIENIYKELQTMEPWYDNAKNITEIAVVFPAKTTEIREDSKLRSAVRMLSELKLQFDVVTTFSDWSKYEVLVIPDDIIFTDEVARRVKAHLAAGKAVISSGSSGLDPEQKKFVLEKEWGVRYLGENSFDPAYFTVGKNFNAGLPDMPLSQYSTGVDLEAMDGTKVEASLIKPYYNRHWDGEYAFYYTPPDKVTDLPALTVNGNVTHFSHRIFSGYADKASVELKRVFSNVLDSYLPDPVFKSGDLPSFARAFVTEQPGRRMVHLLSYVPEMRGQTQMIEEPIKLNNVKISLHVDGKIPEKVYSAPDKK